LQPTGELDDLRDRVPLRRLVAFALFALGAVPLLAACSPTTIDGHEVGPRVCDGGADQPLGEMTCGQFTAFARSQLREEQFGHAEVRETEVYEDPAHYVFGGYGQRAYVVLHLADDSARTYYIQCGAGISKEICLLVEPVVIPS
jgi:hypothetical protein